MAMIKPVDFRELACADCLDGKALGFDISMAFQPIVDVNKREIYAQEALVRGVNNESAGKIFEQVNDSNRYLFDQTCRVKAIALASKLKKGDRFILWLIYFSKNKSVTFFLYLQLVTG